MNVILVTIHVKPEYVPAFTEASRDNAANSLLEPGVLRFDVLQNESDPNRFMLVEVYQNPEAVLAHKETEHYRRWRDTVGPMMAETRIGAKYRGLFPGPDGWKAGP